MAAMTGCTCPECTPVRLCEHCQRERLAIIGERLEHLGATTWPTRERTRA
jgi:hypothetical protein